MMGNYHVRFGKGFVAACLRQELLSYFTHANRPTAVAAYNHAHCSLGRQSLWW